MLTLTDKMKQSRVPYESDLLLNYLKYCAIVFQTRLKKSC